jgi:RNA polymerase sigma-70 factor (ECF subfamily)
MMDPDAVLMVNVREGDSASFELLLHRHRTSVVNHLYRLTRDRSVAEELAQDVFVRIYRSRARYQPEAKFTTWLFRITTNVALNWRRDTRREAGQFRLDDPDAGRMAEIRDGTEPIDECMIRDTQAQEIRAAVETLPPKQLAAVLMHKYEGMDYAQIASVLNCSVGALKSLLFRAYETLRRRLAHFAPVAGQVSNLRAD